MSDIFEKRMEMISKHGSIGNYMLDRADIQENKLFMNNPGFQTGAIYDWDMNKIQDVEFEFEKIKHYYYDREEVEYHVHFRPGYLPEVEMAKYYYRMDGRKRLGMYIDVYNREEKVFEKWLLVAKDDRTNKNRYSILKCNHVFEWVENGELKQIVGIIRRAQDGSFKRSSHDKLGGTSVEGDSSIILPSSETAQKIKLKQRFILSDNPHDPQVYCCDSVDDTSTLGITRFFMKQNLFNPHADYFGKINEETKITFNFPVPVNDLPAEYGGEYHAVCGAIFNKDTSEDGTSALLVCESEAIYVHGSTILIYLVNREMTHSYRWEFMVDGAVYTEEQLEPYFEIREEEDHLSVRAINSVMVKYVLQVNLYDNDELADSVSLEVKV